MTAGRIRAVVGALIVAVTLVVLLVTTDVFGLASSSPQPRAFSFSCAAWAARLDVPFIGPQTAPDQPNSPSTGYGCVTHAETSGSIELGLVRLASADEAAERLTEEARGGCVKTAGKSVETLGDGIRGCLAAEPGAQAGGTSAAAAMYYRVFDTTLVSVTVTAPGPLTLDITTYASTRNTTLHDLLLAEAAEAADLANSLIH